MLVIIQAPIVLEGKGSHVHPYRICHPLYGGGSSHKTRRCMSTKDPSNTLPCQSSWSQEWHLRAHKKTTEGSTKDSLSSLSTSDSPAPNFCGFCCNPRFAADFRAVLRANPAGTPEASGRARPAPRRLAPRAALQPGQKKPPRPKTT